MGVAIPNPFTQSANASGEKREGERKPEIVPPSSLSMQGSMVDATKGLVMLRSQ